MTAVEARTGVGESVGVEEIADWPPEVAAACTEELVEGGIGLGTDEAIGAEAGVEEALSKTTVTDWILEARGDCREEVEPGVDVKLNNVYSREYEVVAVDRATGLLARDASTSDGTGFPEPLGIATTDPTCLLGFVPLETTAATVEFEYEREDVIGTRRGSPSEVVVPGPPVLAVGEAVDD